MFGGTAPAAAQTTFGANLDRPANAAFGCEGYPTFVQFFGPQFVFLPDPSSCTWTSSGTFGTFTESAIVPSDGTVTRARVKTGPSVGPIQVVTLRSLSDAPTPGGGQPAPAQCCIVQTAGPVFTPAPNAVTTIRLNLAVQNNQNAQGVGTFDAIALSILAPNVAIPAHDETAQGANTFSNVFSPAVQPGTQNANRNGVQGVQLLLHADFVPVFPVTLGRRAAPVRGGDALVDLVCGPSAACRGTLALLSRAGAAAKGKRVVLGSARFRIAKGRKSTARVKLSRRGRALVRKRKNTKATLRVTLRNKRATSRTITLRR